MENPTKKKFVEVRDYGIWMRCDWLRRLVIVFGIVASSGYAQMALDLWNWRHVPTPTNLMETIKVNPANDSIWYVTTSIENGQAGLLITRDAGRTWSRILADDFFNPEAVAIHPSSPARVYAAGGLKQILYVSEDYGVSWRSSQLFPAPLASILVSARDGSVYLAPRNTLQGGVYKSRDGGRTWEYRSFGSQQNLICWDIEEDPKSGVLFVPTEIAMRPKFNEPFFRSLDGGATWEDVRTALTPDHYLKVQVDPVRQHVFTLGENVGLHRSTDLGKTWERRLHLGVGELLIDPQRPNWIFAGGPARGTNPGVWLSDDAGATFIRVGLANSGSTSLTFNGAKTRLYSAGYQSGIYVAHLDSPRLTSEQMQGRSGTLARIDCAGCNILERTPTLTVGGRPVAVSRFPLALTFTVPSDLPRGNYPAQLEVAGKILPFILVSTGAPQVTRVENGASFLIGIAAGSWMNIIGTQLAPVTRTWRADEIINGKLPTQLDGVRVTVGGRDAFLWYISPTQISAQAPDGPAVDGSAQVQVITEGIGSNLLTVPIQQYSPGLFRLLPSVFVLAQHADYRLATKPELYPDCTEPILCPIREAEPGETIILYGTGFGPTAPGISAGQTVPAPARTISPVRVYFDGIPADADVWLVSPGLHQLNVRVPETLRSGDVAVIAEVGGRRSSTVTRIPVVRSN